MPTAPSQSLHHNQRMLRRYVENAWLGEAVPHVVLPKYARQDDGSHQGGMLFVDVVVIRFLQRLIHQYIMVL